MALINSSGKIRVGEREREKGGSLVVVTDEANLFLFYDLKSF